MMVFVGRNFYWTTWSFIWVSIKVNYFIQYWTFRVSVNFTPRYFSDLFTLFNFCKRLLNAPQKTCKQYTHHRRHLFSSLQTVYIATLDISGKENLEGSPEIMNPYRIKQHYATKWTRKSLEMMVMMVVIVTI